MVPLHLAWQYFPKREGLISGIVVGGFGLGGFIFGVISTSIVNPENHQMPFPDHVIQNVPFMLQALAYRFTIILIFALILIPKEPDLQTYHYDDDTQTLISKSAPDVVNFSSIFKYLKTKQFVTIFAMNFLSIFFGTYIVGSYKNYGEKTIHDEKYLTLVGAIASVAGVLRFGWSFLIDHYSYKMVYGILICLQIILAFSFPLVAESKPLFGTWVSLTYFTEGGHFTLVPAIIQKLFGNEGSRVFGWAFSFIGIASLVKIVMLELFFEKVGFDGFLYGYGGFCVISLLILVVIFEEKEVEI